MPLHAKDKIDIWACRHNRTGSVYFRIIRSDRVWPKGKQADHWFYACVGNCLNKKSPVCNRSKEIDRFIREKGVAPKYYLTRRDWINEWERELVEREIPLRESREYLAKQARKHMAQGWFVLNGQFGPFKIEL